MPELPFAATRRTPADAKMFAREAHGGQIDKLGVAYFEHVYRVAERAARLAVEAGIDGGLPKQIAYLHDVIEDTPNDADHLRREGFSEEVVSGVLWLTKTGNEPYADWIERLCAEAPLAVLIVKRADVEDNSDPERLSKLDDATQARLRQKYEPALVKLRAAIEERAGR